VEGSDEGPFAISHIGPLVTTMAKKVEEEIVKKKTSIL